MQLTDEQQRIIMGSLWVVNSILKNQGQQRNDDLRQEAILCMCKCLQRYDEKFKVKWTTYAYRNISWYIKKQLIKTNAKLNKTCPLDIFDMSDEIVAPPENESKTLFRILLDACNKKEKRILVLKRNGYSLKAVSKILNLPYGVVCNNIATIKQKAKVISTEIKADDNAPPI